MKHLSYMHSQVFNVPLVVVDRRFLSHYPFVFHFPLLFAVGSVVKALSCAMMASTREAVACLDASYSKSRAAVGLVRPIPPNLAGRANSALSTSEHGGRPIKAGINFWWMASSRG